MTEAFICDAVRTPIGRYGGALSGVRADDLAAIPIRALIERNPSVDWAQLDDVILGCANQAGEDNRNLARMAGLLAGLPDCSGGVTLNRLCGSGLDAVAMAARAIRGGESDLIIAGGSESMSRAPFVLPKAQSPFDRNAEIYDTTMGWRFVNPKMREAYGDDTMPSTAENVADEFDISREDQDAFALRSQERTAAAQANGRLAAEIVSVEIPQRKGDPLIVDRDEHPRPTSLEALAKLKPIVRKDGTVTAGSSSGINDGAAATAHRQRGSGQAQRPHAPRANPRRRRRRGAAANHGHRPRSRLREIAQAARPVGRRHGRHRAERGLCRPGAGRAPQARPARRSGPCEPQRRRDRARPPARHVRRPPGADRDGGASAQRRPLRACHHVHRRRPGDRAGAGTGVSAADIRAVLETVMDPEIPVVSVVDLGIVREVTPERVRITPTYSGCPATEVIERTIREALDAAGFSDVQIETELAPPWTTDWISDKGKSRARLLRHRPARPRQGRDLPAMRLHRYRGSQPLRLDAVQGAMALQGLPGAVRPLQMPLER